MSFDIDKAAKASQPLVDALYTNLTTFSAHAGKLIFYRGNRDPWFSTRFAGSLQTRAEDNGGLDRSTRRT
jgi:feruloyl esterase